VKNHVLEAETCLKASQLDGVVDLIGGNPAFDTKFLVYKYYPNSDLRKLLLSNPTPIFSERLRMLLEVLQTFIAVQQCGLVHRDVRADNILVDSDGRALISDFGCAKVHNGLGVMDSVENGHRSSVSYWVPPEWGGPDEGSYTDMYAVAKLATRLLTGSSKHPLVVSINDTDSFASLGLDLSTCNPVWEHLFNLLEKACCPNFLSRRAVTFFHLHAAVHAVAAVDPPPFMSDDWVPFPGWEGLRTAAAIELQNNKRLREHRRCNHNAVKKQQVLERKDQLRVQAEAKRLKQQEQAYKRRQQNAANTTAGSKKHKNKGGGAAGGSSSERSKRFLVQAHQQR